MGVGEKKMKKENRGAQLGVGVGGVREKKKKIKKWGEWMYG